MFFVRIEGIDRLSIEKSVGGSLCHLSHDQAIWSTLSPQKIRALRADPSGKIRLKHAEANARETYHHVIPLKEDDHSSEEGGGL